MKLFRTLLRNILLAWGLCAVVSVAVFVALSIVYICHQNLIVGMLVFATLGGIVLAVGEYIND